MTRIVKTRSIPNVDDQRLVDDLATLHHLIHTPEGLYEWDRGHGRHLVDVGLKVQKIAAELVRRGHEQPPCRFCR